MMIVDHLMMFVLAVALPLVSAWSYRRYVRRIEAGQPPDRLGQYRVTQILEWSLLAILVAFWLVLGRAFADLGFAWPGGPGFLVGLLLLALLSGVLVYSWRQSRTADAAARAKVVASLGTLRHFLPDSRRALRSFIALSITAGIVEEIVWRGFAFWYLAHYLPSWGVVLVAALVFGLGHAYQGRSNMTLVTLAGIAFGVYYLVTGSIWLPIIAHALVDVMQGATLYEYLRERPAGSGDETPEPTMSTRA